MALLNVCNQHAVLVAESVVKATYYSILHDADLVIIMILSMCGYTYTHTYILSKKEEKMY